MNYQPIACIAILLSSLTSPLAAQTLNERIAAVGPALMNGQAAEAKVQLTKALQECREKKDVHGEALTLLFLGMTEATLNNLDVARADLQESEKKMRAQEDAIGIWLALLVQSQFEQALGHTTEALARMEEAVAVVNKAKVSSAPFSLKTLLIMMPPNALPPGILPMLESSAEMLKPMFFQYFIEPITHDMYGGLLTQVGQLEKAEAELDAASAGSQLFQGMYDFSIAGHFGDLRYRQKRYDEARTYYQKALSGNLQTPFNPAGGQLIQQGIYDRLARLEGMTGHIDDALGWNDKTLESVRASGNRMLECLALSARGSLLMRSKRSSEADKAFQEAMAIAVALKSGQMQASIESSIGSLEIWRGNYGAAASHLERSVQLYQQVNDPLDEAATWGELSNAYMLTDNIASAEDALARARSLVDKHKFALGSDMIAMGETWIRFRKGKATPEEVKAAVQRFKQNAESVNIEFTGNVEQITDNLMQALETGNFSVAAAESKIPMFAAYKSLAEGIHQLDQGNYEKARGIWREALGTNPGSDLQTGLLALIGGSYWREQNYEEASRWFSKAIEALEATGTNLRSESMLVNFLGSYHHAYYDVLIETLLRSGKAQEAFEAAERARARAFLRLLGNRRLKPSRAGSPVAEEAEKIRLQIANWEQEPVAGETLESLQRRYDALLPRAQAAAGEYVSLTSVAPLKVDEVRKDLPADTTLIGYFITVFGIEAWVLDSDTLDHVRLNVDTAKLARITCWAEQLARTRSARPERVVKCDNGAQPADPAEAYAALIAPLRDKIRRNRLMIIPHAELHYVPFAALYDAEKKQYLIQEYPITYVPSASTIRYLHGKETKVEGGALVLGDPIAPPQPRLPGARTEAESVAKLLHTTPKLGSEATESLLYGLRGKVDLLHIAAHAGYDANSPLFSAVYLARSGDGKKDGTLSVDEIQSEVDLSGVNLVVLSACESGVGKRSGGDEIVGLTRAVLYAGSPGVISTLWRISDEATTPLIGKFYAHLLSGELAADALRNAQMELLSDEHYHDPRYWAAFVLTGNPTGCWKAPCR
jgi:CHAT domain-containing protein